MNARSMNAAVSTTALPHGSEPPRRLALIPPALEIVSENMPRAASLPLVLPEYGWIGASASSAPPALVSGIRPVANDHQISPTQPAPALIRRAIATTMPPPSDGSLICVRDIVDVSGI